MSIAGEARRCGARIQKSLKSGAIDRIKPNGRKLLTSLAAPTDPLNGVMTRTDVVATDNQVAHPATAMLRHQGNPNVCVIFDLGKLNAARNQIEIAAFGDLRGNVSFAREGHLSDMDRPGGAL